VSPTPLAHEPSIATLRAGAALARRTRVRGWIAIVVGLVACGGGEASSPRPHDAVAWIATGRAPALPRELTFGMSMDQTEEVLPDLDFHRGRLGFATRIGDDELRVTVGKRGLSEVSVLIPPSELPELEEAWGRPRSIDDWGGPTRLWVDAKAHVRALARSELSRRGKNAVRVTIERYIPVEELLGRTDGRLSIETDLPFLGSNAKALARVYPDLDPKYLQITIPPTELDPAPIEVDLIAEYGGAVNEVFFTLRYGHDEQLRDRIRDLVRQDYGASTEVQDGGFGITVYATPRR
jgi:hypothetical protein